MSFRPTHYPCTDMKPHSEHDHNDGPDSYFYRCPGKTVDELVLAVLRAPLAQRWFVADIATATGMGPDELYPALVRLERSEQVASGWVPGPEPRRRWYQIAQEER